MINNSEQTPRQEASEKTMFPVGKAAVDKALEEIASDPKSAYEQEFDIMSRENTFLCKYVSQIGVLGEEDKRYAAGINEGAFWTYKILRMQAEIHGEKLPRVSANMVDGHLHDMPRVISKIQNSDFNSDKATTELFDNDVELVRAIKEFKKYNVPSFETRCFYFGANEVYSLVKNALHGNELAKKLGV